MKWKTWLPSWVRRISTTHQSARKRSRMKLRARPTCELLEDRIIPAVLLTYGGPGTALTLTETVPGTDIVSIYEDTANSLTIDLNGTHFDPASTWPGGLLTYNGGTPDRFLST